MKKVRKADFVVVFVVGETIEYNPPLERKRPKKIKYDDVFKETIYAC